MSNHHTFIAHFENSQFVEGVYCIHNAQLGQTRNGKPYLKALIRDKSGEIAARMWSISDQQFRSLPTDGFVWLEGQTQPYQGERQLIVQDIRAVDVSEEDLPNLLPATRKDVSQMFAQLQALLDTLEHPAIKALAQEYLQDKQLMEAFRSAPAAVTMHHAFLGGLLEHTLQLCSLADLILPRYPLLNRDIVIMGLFLHDMSKCRELSYNRGFSYTDEGQLLGHLVMGAMLLEKKAQRAGERTGQRLPREALLVLEHIIISHHGQLEFGAAKLPSTPEAVLVSRLDELDAKTQMAIDAARLEYAGDSDDHGDESGGDHRNGNHSEGPAFTEKVWALGTRLFKPDPLAGSRGIPALPPDPKAPTIAGDSSTVPGGGNTSGGQLVNGEGLLQAGDNGPTKSPNTGKLFKN